MKILLTCVAMLLPLSIHAGPGWDELDKLVSDDASEVIELRRWFHENPELSNREFNTSARVAKELEALGLEVETGIAHTGVVGLLRGAKSGPTIALRADMDGLPVKEQTGLPFASNATGEYAGQPVSVMHACGHDAHMAMVLGAARALVQVKDELAGNVLFIFQPAEEMAPKGEQGGAELMIKEGLFERYPVEAIFGMHVGVGQPGGHLAARSGMHMAAVDSFEITVKGKQTHGARPWGGVDPVVTAAQIVGALQTIVSRKLNITEAPAIVTVGKISGGVRHNIIPDEVELWGTIRTFDPDMRTDIHERVERIATDIAHSQDAEVEVDIIQGYPASFNDPDLYEKMLPTLQKVAGENGFAVPPILTVAEDFAFFALEVPGFYFQMGVVADGVDPTTAPSNHSPLFNVEEKYLVKGTRALTHLVVDYLD
jgi:amidohydrolase